MANVDTKALAKAAKASKTLSFRKYPVFSSISLVLMTIFALLIIVPLSWAIYSSFKSITDFYRNPIAFPEIWEFDNYMDALNNIEIEVTTDGNKRVFFNMFGMAANSIWYTLLYATLPLIGDVATAYGCARYRSKWGSLMYGMVIAMMIIPIVGSTGSSLDTSRMMGAYNNPLVAAIWNMKPSGGSRFLICYSLFKGIDKAYSEAAFIDGAGNWKVFITIMMPMAKNIIMVFWVTSLIGYWNDWQSAYIYFPGHPTIAYGLWKFTRNNNPDIPMQLAGCVILAVPMIILFAFIKDHLIGKISFGGLKG